MSENMITSVQHERVSEEHAREFYEILKKSLASYRAKDLSVTDEQWLTAELLAASPEMSEADARAEASEITSAITAYENDFEDVTEAASRGVSKDCWFSEKTASAAAAKGLTAQQYGETLAAIDSVIYDMNMEMSASLHTQSGAVNANPRLHGNIAEHMVANTAKLSATVEGRPVEITIPTSNDANSFDIIMRDSTQPGRIGDQQFQLKWGQDAQSTIKYIEAGNYNNQRIVVPTEQLAEVQAYFKSKGSNKTITDRLPGGKAFSYDDMTRLRDEAQQQGKMPELSYSDITNTQMAMNIARNVGVMSIQGAALTVGLDAASKLLSGEKLDADELAVTAIKAAGSTAANVAVTGAATVAVRREILSFIPKDTSAGTIAGAVCVGLEAARVAAKVADGEMSVTQGVDVMGRSTVALGAGWVTNMIASEAVSAAVTAGIAMIPVVGPALAGMKYVVKAAGFVGSMTSCAAGSKIGSAVYSGVKKVVSAAKSLASTAVKTVTRAVSAVVDTAKSIGRKILSFFGW